MFEVDVKFLPPSLRAEELLLVILPDIILRVILNVNASLALYGELYACHYTRKIYLAAHGI